ncbi:MAG: hydratase [Eubacteriales bacterium]|jgi:aconitate hydratase|nr:hydratase [Eubacteriales bacterium]
MIELFREGVYLIDGVPSESGPLPKEEARKRTIAYNILQAHNRSADPSKLQITFDSLASHDITYVGIVQTARASGLKEFPMPYAMTNCHNSLCAVGGTINEDDHVFGLSAAKKYGGIYVPANQSVIHSYVREEMAACGAMILGSDSHTRYGALGTMGVGEGGPELVKQLLKNTWDTNVPEVVLVYVKGKPAKGIGPHDVAIALVKATFENGFVKNKVMEFAGPGLANLPVDFRNGIDVMTTETTCLTSIWETDEAIREYYAVHKRPEAFKELKAGDGAYYESMIVIDLDKVESMIALPFHPSNAYTIHEFQKNAEEILAGIEKDAAEQFKKATLDLRSKIREDGIYAEQGIIAGCSGGLFDNIDEAAAILKGKSTGNDYFSLSVYPTSVPVSLELTKIGASADLLAAGAVIKPSFCGPCFGAGDVPANNGFSIRHTTRNFPNREGSKPGEGQLAGVALMDARSIAATAANGGRITAATDVAYDYEVHPYHFDKQVYENRIYYGYGKPQPETELILGPNITDWPKMYALTENILLELAAVLHDPVTTTDELIPSGETSSYRSNPLRLAEFTLSRRVPEYVGRSKAIAAMEADRIEGKAPAHITDVLAKVGDPSELVGKTQFGSAIFANKPGDGSAREQAASCQKVLGGFANICYEYATKRYRSNCINWGILPFTLDAGTEFNYEPGDMVFVPGVREAVEKGIETLPAKVIRQNGPVEDITLYIKGLTPDEKTIILEGCLMNYYAAINK